MATQRDRENRKETTELFPLTFRAIYTVATRRLHSCALPNRRLSTEPNAALSLRLRASIRDQTEMNVLRFPNGRAVIAMSALALLIFFADTVTVLDIAVATLYVLVVLLSARFGSTRTVMLVGGGCIALAVISWGLTRPAGPIVEGIVNEVISNLTIALVTLLTVRSLRTEQRHRYQASLLELTRDAFFTWDMSGQILYWNRGAEALYGFDRTVAIGKVVHTLLSTEFVVPLEQIVDRLHQHDSWEGQFVRHRADGTPRIVSCRLTLQRDASGRASIVLETNNDITERVRLEDALEQARSDLVRMNRVLVLGEMTASIAHEIKQPIAAMMTSATAALNWLDQEPAATQKAAQAITRIVDDGNRAVEVLARVRSLVKKAPTRAERWDINEAVDEVIALTRSDVARNGIHLLREPYQSSLFITGDRIQVQQVLINLIVNAIDAMHGVHDNPRELTVATGVDAQGDAFIQVRDTGVGIDEAELAHVFESFYTTKAEGMGMGLAICRSIAEAHGGRIDVEANQPRGAVFRLTIPVERHERSAAVPSHV
ncbi:two-component system sensor kinase FixL [Paraburkholderia youngii]|uniref:two-component system sensor histidine kinase NtrB n=1 Tax=Paraburkholderia youngii TaxID=2782701 RepID=UPI003D1EA3B7